MGEENSRSAREVGGDLVGERNIASTVVFEEVFKVVFKEVAEVVVVVEVEEGRVFSLA